MVEFLIDNTIWVIVGVIVLIMAIIGYFAENSELGKKVMKTNKKTENKNQNRLPEQTENNGSESLTANITDIVLDETPIAPTQNINNDAWSNNVNTDISEPSETIINNPNDWLETPALNPQTEPTISEENNPVENVVADDSFYNLPTETIVNSELPEVSVETFPTEENKKEEISNTVDEFSGIEVLYVDEPAAENIFLDEINNLQAENQVAEDSSSENIWK